MIEKSNISEVRKNIEGCVGQKVLLRGSLGRNKSFEKYLTENEIWYAVEYYTKDIEYVRI
mgnify:CR=1 FL=1